MDTTTLTSAYEALRDFLTEQQLYNDSPVEGFDREQLAQLMTAYYDVEAATLDAIGGARNDATAQSVLDDMAKKLGYDSYVHMVEGGENNTIIKDGKIRTDLIDTKAILTEGIVVTDASKGAVTIRPNDGLKLLDSNNEVTATFSGEKIGSLTNLIPQNANIMLSEKVVFDTNTDVATQTLTLASGIVTTKSGTKITVAIPEFAVKARMKYSEPTSPPSSSGGSGPLQPLPTGKKNPNPVTLWAELLVQDKRTAYVSYTVDHFMRQAQYKEPGIPPMWYFSADVSLGDVMPAQTITCTTPSFPQNNTTNTPITVKLRYGISSLNSFKPMGMWEFAVGARKPGTPLDQTQLAGESIMVGGAIYNSAFFGNGLLFSRATDQFAGLATPKNGPAELIVRSGTQGFSVDGKGPQRWSNKRQEWIPADGVLFRGFSYKGGMSEFKQWSYNGEQLAVKPVIEGILEVTFPTNMFIAVSDYFVRTNLVLADWYNNPPSIYTEMNRVNSFRLTTAVVEYGARNQGFMFEVLYTGDWR